GSAAGRAKKYGTRVAATDASYGAIRCRRQGGGRVGQQIEFGIYVPQLAFGSFWAYDHLYGPGRPDAPAFEGWTLATALLAQTSRIRVGHMVLCATFRHPVLLGKMATSLDVISNGRLNLGIGSGSVEQEHHEAVIPWGTLAERTEILEETLEIITRMFTGEPTTFDGKRFQVRDFPNVPPPVQ